MISSLKMWLCAFLVSSGFTDVAGDCEALMQSAIEKARKDRELASVRGFTMESKLIIKMQKGETVKMEVSVKAGSRKYYLKNGTTQLYQDENAMVVIDHKERTVFITRPMSEGARTKQFEGVLKLQDSLVRYFKVNRCSKEFGTVVSGVGLQRINMVPSRDEVGKEIKSISYWIDTETLRVHKVGIYYSPSSQSGIQEYEMEIGEMVIGDQTCFEGSALGKVLLNNSIRGEYKGYRVIDKSRITATKH